MEPTIEAGSSVLVSQLSASARIKRGEVVILRAPSKVKGACGSDATELIDRVIGLPGDHLSSKGNTILVNGEPLHQTWTHTEPLGMAIASVTIASDHYYVVGDNQSDSCDSRHWGT
ncbi:MAG: signal peptidase I, partial [Acidimicrobiales bacterium]